MDITQNSAILSVITYLCKCKAGKNKMDTILSKQIDETKQGESYAPFSNDPNIYNKRFYIESYGCAMNFNDSEIVASILNQAKFGATRDVEEADLILINTCSIRDKAEQTIRRRLQQFSAIKRNNPQLLIGILGCMAERLKVKLLEEEQLWTLLLDQMRIEVYRN